jgi:hypothetical protein
MPNPVDTDKVAAVGPEPNGPAIGLDADGLPSVPRPTAVAAVPGAPDARRNGWRGWPAVFSSTRTRLLVIFFALLAIFGAGTTFAIREILEIRLDDRTQTALRQEVQEIQRLLQIGRNP